MRGTLNLDPDTEMVIGLEEAGSRPLHEIGGKAHGLSRLVAAGVRVPRGVVLSTAALHLFLQENHLKGDAKPEDITTRTMPGEVMAALADVLQRLVGPLAVRSSATGEDQSGASYAGLYESVLDVEGIEAVADAVRLCWASTYGSRAASYRAGRGGRGGEMAVVIQEMVPAESAGVAFTADPVTGSDEIVIEATLGLGDKLVAGEVVPERWVLSGGDDIKLTGGEPTILSLDQVRAVADYARQISSIVGSPQDVEWAIAAGKVWVLQSRPITALPIAPHIDVPKGQTWVREDEYFPEPVKPLEFSAWFPLQDDVFADIFSELGLPLQTIAHRLIGGRVYIRVVPVGDVGKERTPPPPWILGLLMRLVPELRNRMKVAVAVDTDDLAMRAVEEWELRRKVALRTRADLLRQRDLESLDDQSLASHLGDVMTHLEEAFRDHFRLVFLSVYLATGQLGMFLEDTLGWESSKSIQLLQGHGYQAEADAFDHLVAAIGSDPEARALLAEDPRALPDHPGAGGDYLRRYLYKHGHRMVGVDLSQPTYAEDPRPLLGLIREGLRRPSPARQFSDHAGPVESEARGALVGRTDPLREFDRLLQRARRGHPYGEETEFDVGEAMALIRYVAVEVGSRLQQHEVLSDPEAVHFLTLDEMKDALRRRHTTIDVAQRLGEHRWALANPAPRSYGPAPTQLPDFRHAPRPARPVLSGFAWSMKNLFPPPTIQDPEGFLEGMAASPGRATGEVRVIMSPAEFDRVKLGDVLVCPSTMASWTVVFPLISAVVTEYGGPLSHPAILAREFGIPAVVSLPEATTRFRDGETVTVDGAKGQVHSSWRTGNDRKE